MFTTQRIFVTIFALSWLGIAACSGGGGGGGGNNTGGGGGGGMTPLTLSFGNPTTLDAGAAVPSKAQTIAAAEFNGDGKVDVAVLNNGISVFLGKGDGAFQPKTDITTNGAPTALTSGLFDAGTTLDLAAATGNNFIDFLKNNNGAFNPPQDVAAGNAPEGVAAGDFDGDGKLDVAVSVSSDGSLQILYGDGNFGFSPNNYTSNGKITGPRNVVAADFNKDGKLDLAFAVFGNDNVAVWTNSGDADRAKLFPDSNINALKLPTGSGVQGLLAADFNGDGFPDIAAPNPSTKNVSVFLNQAGGGFSEGKLLLAGADAFAAAVGDFNKDGKPDLVVVNAFGLDGTNGDFGIYLGNGDGTFQSAKAFTVGKDSANNPNHPRSVAVADFNGDGKPDVVTANSPAGTTLTSTISVILNTSN